MSTLLPKIDSSYPRRGSCRIAARGRTPEQVERDIERDKIPTADMAEEYGIVDQVFRPARSRRVRPASAGPTP